MTDLTFQKRLAAEVLGVGVSRIRFNPERLEEIAEAFSREDIRRLIRDGAIEVLPKKGNSRGRWRVLHQKRKKGHRRGHGKRRGAKGARQDPKEKWVNTIRKLRRYLRWLRDHGVIDRHTYRKLYMAAKGGQFDSLSDLKRYLREMGYQVR